MVTRLAVLFVLAFAAAAVAAAEIYKWIDEQGRTQYGNSVPKAQRSKAKPIEVDPAVSDAQREEAEARLVKDRALAESMTRERQKAVPKDAGKASAPSVAVKAPPTASPQLDKKKQCEEDWKRYQASQACFAPYRTATGGIRAEAFQRCTEVKQPAYCE